MGETTQGRTGKWAKRPGGRNDSGRKGKWAKRLRGERESGRNDPDSFLGCLSAVLVVRVPFLFSAVLVVRVPFPFGVWGRVWNSIVPVPDHAFLSTFRFTLYNYKCTIVCYFQTFPGKIKDISRDKY